MLLDKTYSPLQLLKPANYEISKTRKYKNDIGKIENMEYDKISDFIHVRITGNLQYHI